MGQVRPSRLPVAAAVVAATAVALVVRWQGAGRDFWLDELVTAWVVRDGFGPIFQRAWVANLSPLYFLFVRTSVELLGSNELGMRAPSILAGALLVPAAYLLGSRVSGSALGGVMAGLFAAFDPTSIAFSLEVRPYALIQLVGALQVYAFLVLVDRATPAGGKRSPWPVLLYGTLTAIGWYLHVLFLLILGPEILFVLLVAARDGRASFRGLAGVPAGWAVAGVLCIPLLRHFLYLGGGKGVLGSYIYAGDPETVFGRFHAVTYVLIPLAIGYVVQLVTGAKVPAAGDDGRADRRRHDWAFALLWFLIPSAFVWLTTKAGVLRIDRDRYIIASATAPILMAVGACWLFSGRAARACAVAWCFAFLALLAVPAVRGTLPAFHKGSGWRGGVSFVNREGRDGRPVLVRCGLAEEQWLATRKDDLLRGYLLCTVNSLYRIDAPPSRAVFPVTEAADPGENVGLIDKEGGFLLVGCFGSESALHEKAEKIITSLGREPSRAKIVLWRERSEGRPANEMVSAISVWLPKREDDSQAGGSE